MTCAEHSSDVMQDTDVNNSDEVFNRTLTTEESYDLTETDESPIAVSFSTQDYPIDGLVKRISSGAMIVPQFGRMDDRVRTAGFQRGFVWTKAQMDRFIESLLLGYPVPGIFLVRQTQDQRMLVLDGQQRLETLRRFYNGVHADKIFSLLNVGDDYKGLTYQTLSESDRMKLDDSYLQATIVVSDGSTQINESVYQIFERLNSGGTQLTPHEIRVALYAGSLVALVEDLNADEDWRALFGARSKRIRDHELISRVLALYMHSADYARPLKGFLNKFYSDHRNGADITDTLTGTFKEAARLLRQEVGPTAFRSTIGTQVNAAQGEAVMVGLMRALDAGTTPCDLNARVARLKEDEVFGRRTISSTADKDAVMERLHLATEAFS